MRNIKDIEVGEGTVISNQVNLYKCKIGKNCKIHSFVYIEEGVVIGDNCIIKPFTYIPSGVKIGNRVFVGSHVAFTNDKYPQARGEEWKLLETIIEDDVSIGSGSVILPVRIGKSVIVGAGTVVTKDVPNNVVIISNPAHIIKTR